MGRSRHRVETGAVTLTAAMLGMAATTLAGDIPPSPLNYDFEVIAETGEGGVVELGGATLNTLGEVVFHVVTDDGESIVFHFAGGAVEQVAGAAQGFADAGNPVLNDDGDIAFVGSEDESTIGIYLFDPVEMDFEMIYDGFDALSFGQLSLNNNDQIAFWDLTCGKTCQTVTHRILLQDVTDPKSLEEIASATAGLGSSAAAVTPIVNDDGVVAYRRVNDDAESAVELWDSGAADSIVEIGAGELMSSPSLDLLNDVVLFIDSEDLSAGAYHVQPDGTTTLLVDLSTPALLPAALTGPRVNDADGIALTAIDDAGDEVLLIKNGKDEPRLVLRAGAVGFGETVTGDFSLLGYNDEGQILFKATRSVPPGGTALVLAGPAPCRADLNQDEIVDIADLLILLAAWGPCPGCDADIDDNGDVNIFDLLVVLAAWGNPCPE